MDKLKALWDRYSVAIAIILIGVCLLLLSELLKLWAIIGGN